MTKVLILGGTGNLGTQLTKELLAQSDDQITLFARHPTTSQNTNQRVQMIAGDATDKGDLRKALSGQDVVYCAISGRSLPQVAHNLVDMMPAANVDRLILTAAIGIYNEIPAGIDGRDNVKNNPLQVPNRQAADIIEKSDLNYTVLRPGYLQDGSASDFVLTKKGQPAKGYVTTLASVVKLADQLINAPQLYSRQSIGITKDMTK